MTPHIFKLGDKAFHPAHGVVEVCGVIGDPDSIIVPSINYVYTKHGRYSASDKFPTLLTLEEARIRYPERMPKEPREFWVNVGHCSCGCFNGPCTERAKHDCVEMGEVL
jgi:hypothetical protein